MPHAGRRSRDPLPGVDRPAEPDAPALERVVPVDGPLDLRSTLAIHSRGRGDPTLALEPDGRAWRATRTAAGPVTLLLVPIVGAVRVTAWGPGAEAALGAVPDLLGVHDDPRAFAPSHPLLARLAHRFAGVRFGRTGAVLEALVPAVLEQKVTGAEARRTYRALVRVHGEAAPGPRGLRLQPPAATLARLPYHAWHPLGLERRRAEVIRHLARDSGRVEATAALAGEGRLDAAYATLRSYPGVGPWSAAEVGARAFGDPDAVSVGDFHLPHLVAWALAGEPRGTDERMLELLEPWRGQRGRVVRLLELSGLAPPRYGPRLPSRRIDRL